MSIRGGYKTITITQLGNLLHALKTGQITWLAARVWCAGLEMIAIREAATRCQRLQRRPRRKAIPVRFSRTELAELTRLSPRAIGFALGQLRRLGLAEFQTASIAVANTSVLLEVVWVNFRPLGLGSELKRAGGRALSLRSRPPAAKMSFDIPFVPSGCMGLNFRQHAG